MTTTRQTTTREIAGFAVTLEPGNRYVASRPMASRTRRIYPVEFTQADRDGFDVMAAPDFVLQGLDFDEANAVLAEFNNGSCSFDGRWWH